MQGIVTADMKNEASKTYMLSEIAMLEDKLTVLTNLNIDGRKK